MSDSEFPRYDYYYSLTGFGANGTGDRIARLAPNIALRSLGLLEQPDLHLEHLMRLKCLHDPRYASCYAAEYESYGAGRPTLCRVLISIQKHPKGIECLYWPNIVNWTKGAVMISNAIDGSVTYLEFDVVWEESGQPKLTFPEIEARTPEF